jgi:hypothetical protein
MDSVATTDSVVKHNDITIIDPENIFKPRILIVLIFQKMISTTVRIIICLKPLVNLGTFKFVKINLRSLTINYLDAYYYLTTA